MTAGSTSTAQTESAAITSAGSQIVQLAAAAILLDPARRELRIDVLLSTTMAILSIHGPLTEEVLLFSVQQEWATKAVTIETLQACLTQGEELGQIVRRKNLSGETQYCVEKSSADEISRDVEWAHEAKRQFVGDVETRLLEYPNDRLTKRSEKITNHVIDCVSTSMSDDGAVEADGVSQWIRPMNPTIESMAEHASTIEPEFIREAVLDLAISALDVDDPFGNEIVHHIAVRSVMQRLVAQHVPTVTTPVLRGSRIVLDTNVLVTLVEGDSDDTRLLHRLINYSAKAGVEVFVPQHIVAEWNRLWEAADRETEHVGPAVYDKLAARLEGNPFVAAYLRETRGRSKPFADWSRDKRNLPKLLTGYPVQVIDFGGVSGIDRTFVSQMHAALTPVGHDTSHGRKLTDEAAVADAQSAGMVASWRADPAVARSYFVTYDSLTGSSYRRLTSDTEPLMVKPNNWLLTVANLIVDDPVERFDIGEVVAKSSVRRAVLGIASGYTVDEVLRISALVTRDGGELDARQARALSDPRLFDEDGSIADKANRLRDNQLRRRDLRISRERSQAKAIEDALAAKERDLDSANSEINDLSKSYTRLLSTTRTAEEIAAERDTIWRRRVATGIVGLLLAGITLLIWPFRVIAVHGVNAPLLAAVPFLILIAGGSSLWAWFSDPSTTWKKALLPFFTAVALGTAAVIAGLLVNG